MKPALPRGLYVVAWKILSDDSHPVTGLRTFTVR
ncbi:copper resistance protein CopC [Deinococcus sp. 14RED07]|nr:MULTISPECIES: copper resistance protein CopC [unclassified Deinococcus]MCD0159849.1 copper resistance protein CopC [Deinococcus sp. 6YEL10]MCD0174640.1 copper resistance protein CopC [Deinococcus sp. 14RED07]